MSQTELKLYMYNSMIFEHMWFQNWLGWQTMFTFQKEIWFNDLIVDVPMLIWFDGTRCSNADNFDVGYLEIIEENDGADDAIDHEDEANNVRQANVAERNPVYNFLRQLNVFEITK